MSWKLNKTEQTLHDQLLTGKTVIPEGERQLKAMGKIYDALNYTGSCAALTGVVINTNTSRSDGHYQYIPIALIVKLYTSHFDVREPSGTQTIIIRK